MDTLLTAELAANSPRFRRKSSTFVDAIHDLPGKGEMAPAQLYSTESGRLFHSGRIAIATVGLPARGKTCADHKLLSVTSPLLWQDTFDGKRTPIPLEYAMANSMADFASRSCRLGVKTRVFHLGDYRRATVGPGQDVPDDYFFVNGTVDTASASSVLLRQKILKKCREDIYHFLNHENGQIAIYDAVNPLAAGRRSLAKEFAKHDVETLFIESACDDERLIEENVRSVKISSPDYVGWASDDAVRHYLARISAKIPHFETMEEKDLNYIKACIRNERAYHAHYPFILLLELTAGMSEEDSYKADGSLSVSGREYAKTMSDTLIRHRQDERQALIDKGGSAAPLKSLTVWASTRRRTVETSAYLQEQGFRVRQRSQMSQLNPGVCEKMSERAIRREFPEEVAKHEADPYHHRYPRAESYHDLAVRLEPIILELEREQNDLLIIAHESVLRVLYGYLMACNATDIPQLEFPRNEIIEIIPASYNNEAKRIHIPGLPDETIPGSPEDISIPVPPSGFVSPMTGLGTPQNGGGTPRNGVSTPQESNANSFVREAGGTKGS
ncbi:MAG: hypothetical protein M1827_005700 [Pycnora praestabilis]|nr:MAG: hypothetical protein M1827_005700 [Pycnora praestabilis]